MGWGKKLRKSVKKGLKKAGLTKKRVKNIGKDVGKGMRKAAPAVGFALTFTPYGWVAVPVAGGMGLLGSAMEGRNTMRNLQSMGRGLAGAAVGGIVHNWGGAALNALDDAVAEATKQSSVTVTSVPTSASVQAATQGATQAAAQGGKPFVFGTATRAAQRAAEQAAQKAATQGLLSRTLDVVNKAAPALSLGMMGYSMYQGQKAGEELEDAAQQPVDVAGTYQRMFGTAPGPMPTLYSGPVLSSPIKPYNLSPVLPDTGASMFSSASPFRSFTRPDRGPLGYY